MLLDGLLIARKIVLVVITSETKSTVILVGQSSIYIISHIVGQTIFQYLKVLVDKFHADLLQRDVIQTKKNLPMFLTAVMLAANP